MNLNTECPKCKSESAYHNGICYECPDCGYEWNDDLDFEAGDF
jgi:protein PhnA